MKKLSIVSLILLTSSLGLTASQEENEQFEQLLRQALSVQENYHYEIQLDVNKRHLSQIQQQVQESEEQIKRVSTEIFQLKEILDLQMTSSYKCTEGFLEQMAGLFRGWSVELAEIQGRLERAKNSAAQDCKDQEKQLIRSVDGNDDVIIIDCDESLQKLTGLLTEAEGLQRMIEDNHKRILTQKSDCLYQKILDL